MWSFVVAEFYTKTECLCIVGEGEFVSRFGNFVAVRDLYLHKFIREIM